MNKADKLVAMANQIAGYFRTQPGDQAGAVAEHLRKFWTPGMCSTLAAQAEAGGALEPLARQAVERLHVTS